MRKINGLLLYLFLILILLYSYSCYKVVKVEPTPVPTPTPTPPNAYQPFVRLDQKGECNLGDRTLFEVKPDGTFTYTNNVAVSENRTIEAPISFKLSANELANLKNLLDTSDLAELAKKDTPLPAGTVQTEECRAIDYFTFNVNNQDRVFDRNARLVTHSPEYTAAMDKIFNMLDSLKKPQEVQIFPYDFPLTVTATDECNPNAPPKTLFNVSGDGDFTYLATDKNERIVRKKITQEQLNALKNLLDAINLSTLAANESNPYQETAENQKCRVIENYMVMHNSREEFFDRNGRKYQHSKEYLAALDKLKNMLEKLKNPKDLPKGRLW